MKIDEILNDIMIRHKSAQQGPYFTKPQQDEIPELVSKIREKIATPRENELSAYERYLGPCALWFDQTGLRGPLKSEWCNAKNPTYIVNSLRSCAAWEPVPDADKTLKRLPLDDIHAICPMAGCGKFLLYRDKHGNVPTGRKKSDADCKHSRAIAAREMALQAHREQKTGTRKKAARREYKENRGKPDPESAKAMEKRKKALRDKEKAAGAPSREERRKSRGF